MEDNRTLPDGLPEGWTYKRLIDCTSNNSISYGIVQPGSKVTQGVPMLRVNNIVSGRLDLSEVVKVSSDVEQKFSKTRLQGGEVVLTLVGSTGQCAIVPESMKGWNVARAIAVIRPSYDIGPEWLNICIQSKVCQNFLDVRANTTVQKTINLKDVRELLIPVPPIEQKQYIESCLTSLGKKIDLNRQTNQTLESMAQALFKSWFVDFDPVIDNALAAGNEIPEPLAAKATARRALQEQGTDKANQPHTLPDHIRDLFPSSFQFTEELGWIPEGWGVKPFRSVAQHIKESASAQNIDPNEVYVGLEHIGRKQLFLENSGIGSDVESNKSRFQKGDLLFGKLRPYFHKVALTDTSGICSTDILVFRAEDAAYQAFMALTAYREDFVAHANACSSGTRMPRANAKDLLEYQVVVPTRDLAQQLKTTIAPMWEKAHANLLKNSRLSKIRDTLLPKLLSGELRIPETEKMLDEALA